MTNTTDSSIEKNTANKADADTNAGGTTHFGYQQVRAEEKAGKVAGVFHSVADSYDIMNDLMSMGIHRLWKRYTIEMSGVRAGQRVLDIAGGTGDLAARFAQLVGPEGEVVLADINDSMLKVGRDRLADGPFLAAADVLLDPVQPRAHVLVVGRRQPRHGRRAR